MLQAHTLLWFCHGRSFRLSLNRLGSVKMKAIKPKLFFMPLDQMSSRYGTAAHSSSVSPPINYYT
jgi:hypothetical protein